MPSKKEETEARLAVLFLMFICYGFGIFYLYRDVLGGLAMIGVGFFCTMLLFPPVGRGVRAIMVWMVQRARKRVAQRRQRGMIPQNVMNPEQKVAMNTQLQRIVSILETCPLPTRLRRDAPENDVETFLEARLRDEFPSLKRQQVFGHSRFDIEIGDVGIEIKLPKGQRDVDALKGQIQTYLKRFSYAIAFIINYYRISQEIIGDFKRDVSIYMVIE
jgi:hypothetical protein